MNDNHPDHGKRFTDQDVIDALGFATTAIHDELVERGEIPPDTDILKAKGLALLALHTEAVRAGALPAGAVSQRLRTYAGDTEGQNVILRHFADVFNELQPDLAPRPAAS